MTAGKNCVQPFPEEQWLKHLFLLNDAQSRLKEQQRQLLSMLPVPGMKKFYCHRFYLTISALAHIIERHYIKINRYPFKGKFTVSIVEILAHIRDCSSLPSRPLPGSLLKQRVSDTRAIIGYNQYGQPTSWLTVVTDAAGKIITAFPGTIPSKKKFYEKA